MEQSFLQSKQWESFQVALGRRTFRIENKLIIKYNLPLGLNYLYSPRPDFTNEKKFKNFLAEAKKLAHKENAVFSRIEPDLESNLQPTAYKLQTCKNLQPQDTLILDLDKSEEKLLNEMHPKTRYNIRLAERHNIKIKKSTNPKDIDIFYSLALKTSSRDGFRYHPKSYYKTMLETLGDNKSVELFIAFTKDVPIAAIMVLFYKNTAVYLHGASDHNFRNLMAPYLLQWAAIKEAKKQNHQTYDFWGIAPSQKLDENHPWAGITRFKMGFAPNGKILHYPKCFEMPIQKSLYTAYKMIKLIRGK